MATNIMCYQMHTVALVYGLDLISLSLCGSAENQQDDRFVQVSTLCIIYVYCILTEYYILLVPTVQYVESSMLYMITLCIQ